MRARAVIAAIAASAPAWAGPTVVWFEPAVPPARDVDRATRIAGAATQLAHADLAFPPQPVSSADDDAYKNLRDAVAGARTKWDDFEVELGIAQDLEAVLGKITVVRDQRDLDGLIGARALQGAAVLRAFDPLDFQEGERAKEFRVQYFGTKQLNRPWVAALALDDDHRLNQDQADQSTWSDLQAMQEEVALLGEGTLDVAGAPEGVQLVIDGRPVAMGGTKIPLRPGVHYLHAVRGEKVAGRATFEVTPKETVVLPMVVSAEELGQAHAALIAGSTQFPADVASALDAVIAHANGPVFVAAVDDGKVTVLPYAGNAQLIKQTPVTWNLTGEIGPELVVSALFDDSNGESVTAPAVSASLGFDLSVYYGVIAGGMDVALTPTQTMAYANADKTANVHAFALPQPWGGLGVYPVRPTGGTPFVLLLGTYGWNGPANMAFGGRLAVGIPVGDGSWFKVTVGGNTSPKSMWDGALGGNYPMHVLFLRVGLSSGLLL